MANISKEERFKALVSHYKDSFEIHTASIKERNKLFVYLLIILAIFLVQLRDYAFAEQIFNALIKKNFGDNIEAYKFIPVLIWFVLVGVSLRYFQVNVQIEQQYNYLHRLEKELNSMFINSAAYTREGVSYLSDYPLFSTWLWLLYTWIFPLVLLISIITRIYVDINSWPPTYSAICCFVAYEICGASIIFYLLKVHWRK